MNLVPIARFVAYAHFAIAAAMIVPWIFAFRSTTVSATGYGLGVLVGGLIGALCLAGVSGIPRRRMVRNGLRELMIALLIFWAVVPFSAGLPFLLEGYSLSEAWFEAVSAITTTGGWLSDKIARSTPQDMLYRGSLQWLGGLVSIATAAAVFVRPEFIGIDSLIPPFARGQSGSYFRAFERGVRAFFPVYLLITIIGFAGFLVFGVPLVPAATMALSFVASGGFVPHPAGLEAFPPGVVLIAGTLMTFSAVNFIVLATVALGVGPRLGRTGDPETRAFLMLIPFVAIIFWLSRGAGDVDRIFANLLNATSVLSTNGILVGSPTPALVPVLVTAIIGGAAVSTAGGIKLLRWMVTMRRASEEIWRLTHPGAVLRSKRSVNEFGVWIHTLAFAVILALIVLTTAFYGFSLEASAAVAVAVISNAGPLLQIAPDMTADYQVFGGSLRTLFGIGMIAGRLELVVLLVVFNRRFWTE